MMIISINSRISSSAGLRVWIVRVCEVHQYDRSFRFKSPRRADSLSTERGTWPIIASQHRKAAVSCKIQARSMEHQEKGTSVTLLPHPFTIDIYGIRCVAVSNSLFPLPFPSTSPSLLVLFALFFLSRFLFLDISPSFRACWT